jgi:hypothetical protein
MLRLGGRRTATGKHPRASPVIAVVGEANRVSVFVQGNEGCLSDFWRPRLYRTTGIIAVPSS